MNYPFRTLGSDHLTLRVGAFIRLIVTSAKSNLKKTLINACYIFDDWMLCCIFYIFMLRKLTLLV